MRVVRLPRIIPILLTVALAACSRDGAGTPARPTGEEPGRPAVFRSADEVELRGRVFGSGSSGIVLAHMFPSDSRSWYPMAQRLASRGYLAVAFNFRGYSPSGGARDAAAAPADVSAAMDYLRAAGATTVALVGASMGGTAALVVASRTPVAAVVAISAPLEFQGLDASSTASRITAPVLLLAAEGDESASDSLRRLATLVPGSTAKLFEGSAHGTNLFGDRPGAGEVVTDFLEDNAPPSG